MAFGYKFPPPDFRFHDEFLWATTLALREGCVVGNEIGVDEQLLDEARMLADMLDMAIERHCRGKEKEGPLGEWYKKQATD